MCFYLTVHKALASVELFLCPMLIYLSRATGVRSAVALNVLPFPFFMFKIILSPSMWPEISMDLENRPCLPVAEILMASPTR